MNMAFGQMVAGRIGFPWGVAPGYVEYGRWPIRRRGGSDFHGALPQATLNMAVGQMVAGRIGFPWIRKRRQSSGKKRQRLFLDEVPGRDKGLNKLSRFGRHAVGE